MYGKSPLKRNVFFAQRDKKKSLIIINGEEREEEATLRRAEKEEEEGERGGDRTGESGVGEVEAWTDEVMDGVGVASQGCVCLACLVEIEYDGSVFLFRGE